MTPKDFTSIFLNHIKPGHKVLDLGAGSGDFSQMFADKGAIVTAVDSKIPVDLGESIIPKKMKIEEFIAHENDERYDLIFLRNILQFLDKQWVFDVLLPWFQGHLNTGGIIGIETFYQEPEPAFDHPMRSLYSAPELSGHFLSWQEIHLQQYDHRKFSQMDQDNYDRSCRAFPLHPC